MTKNIELKTIPHIKKGSIFCSARIRKIYNLDSAQLEQLKPGVKIECPGCGKDVPIESYKEIQVEQMNLFSQFLEERALKIKYR